MSESQCLLFASVSGEHGTIHAHVHVQCRLTTLFTSYSPLNTSLNSPGGALLMKLDTILIYNYTEKHRNTEAYVHCVVSFVGNFLSKHFYQHNVHVYTQCTCTCTHTCTCTCILYIITTSGLRFLVDAYMYSTCRTSTSTSTTYTCTRCNWANTASPDKITLMVNLTWYVYMYKCT